MPEPFPEGAPEAHDGAAAPLAFAAHVEALRRAGLAPTFASFEVTLGPDPGDTYEVGLHPDGSGHVRRWQGDARRDPAHHGTWSGPVFAFARLPDALRWLQARRRPQG
jgi:hypothetical protein